MQMHVKVSFKGLNRQIQSVFKVKQHAMGQAIAKVSRRAREKHKYKSARQSHKPEYQCVKTRIGRFR